jgi:hypothetical protein
MLAEGVGSLEGSPLGGGAPREAPACYMKQTNGLQLHSFVNDTETHFLSERHILRFHTGRSEVAGNAPPDPAWNEFLSGEENDRPYDLMGC